MLKKIRVILILIIGFAIISSCETTPKSEELHKEVIVFHDEAMVHMTTLYRAQKALKEKLSDTDSTTALAKVSELQSQLKTIESARGNMMTWMRDFKVNYNDELSEEQKVRVLKDELVKVKSVNDEINEAVELSKKL